jgi:hypothetical protein
MPSIQVSHPVFAPIAVECNEKETVYLPGVKIGNMVTVSTAENFLPVPAFAGGGAVFKNATVAVNTTSIPLLAYKIMFGMKINGNILKDPPRVGVWGGFGYVEGNINEKCDYEVVVTWIKRCNFTPPPVSRVSKFNGKVTLTTPSFTGQALLDGCSEWRERYIFETAAEAIRFLNFKAGISE